jgi:hypothetical protein
MKATLGYSVLAAITVVGCASDPNLVWSEGAAMSFEVTEIGKGSYNLSAKGAGAHSKEQVERAFLNRAVELCGGQPLQRTFESRSYEYSAPTGIPAYSSRHSAFMTTGTIKCS